MVWKLLRRLLFRFDPEATHHLMGFMVRILVGVSRLLRLPKPIRPLRIISGVNPNDSIPIQVSGLQFSGPVGLAAGFDKTGEWLASLPDLGFDFVEIGTVTPRPQSGNPRPRIYRDPAAEALFNRMGFNSLGAELTRRQLEVQRGHLPASFRVGINIGKNRTTPAAEAYADYQEAARQLAPLADFMVINVSSPNTPGLRDLQNFDALRQIVDAVQGVLQKRKAPPPLWIKLAPEWKDAEPQRFVEGLEQLGISGWVLANTLQGTWGPATSGVTGGWSGGPLTVGSREMLRSFRGLTKKTLVSVGGILSSAEAQKRLELGANLLEVYSGWVLKGPRFPAQIKTALSETLKAALKD